MGVYLWRREAHPVGDRMTVHHALFMRGLDSCCHQNFYCQNGLIAERTARSAPLPLA